MDSGLPPAVDLDFERWRRRQKLGWEQKDKSPGTAGLSSAPFERCICFDFTGLTVIILTGGGLCSSTVSPEEKEQGVLVLMFLLRG